MPILDQHALDFWSHSPEQTLRFGARLGELLQPGDLLTLSGDLGAGKTLFVNGLSRGWGSADQVTSPTFVLVNEYHRPGGERMYHLDCYRLASAADALSMGFEDLLDAEAVMVIEWPERIAPLLPVERLQLSLSWASETRRTLRLEAAGARYLDLLEHFRRAAFAA